MYIYILCAYIVLAQDRHARAAAEMETLDDKIDTSMARRVEIDAQNAE